MIVLRHKVISRVTCVIQTVILQLDTLIEFSTFLTSRTLTFSLPHIIPIHFAIDLTESQPAEKFWMNNSIIKDIFQKENITFYQPTEFDLVDNDVSRATIRGLRKEVVLVPIFLTADFTLDNFIDDVSILEHSLPSSAMCHVNLMSKILSILKIKKYQELERKFLVECSKSYLLVMEYPNGGSLRQYLKKNFSKMNWSTKITFAKQIANVLMFLHANDCSPVYLTSEKIFVHNESIRLSSVGLIGQSKRPLKPLEKIHGTFQYTDSQYLKIQDAITNQKSSDIYSLGVLLFEIASGKRPLKMESPSRIDLLNVAMKHNQGNIDPEALSGYLKVHTDCCQYDENLRPNIVQVVKDLERVSVSGTGNFPSGVVESEAGQSKSSLESNSTSNVQTPETDIFIRHLFDFFSEQYNMQNFVISPNLVRKYIKDFNRNPVRVKSTPSPFAGIYEVNRAIGQLCLANLYLDGKGIKQDQKKSFQMMLKAAEGGSSRALNCMAFCYDNGYGLEKDENSAFRLYLKSAEQGNLLAQCNLGICYQEGIGTSINEIKGFQLHLRSFISGSITATYRIGDCYFDGRGTRKNKKTAFEWYLTSSEDDYNMAQSDAGYCYGTGTGTLSDQKKAFEYYLKAAQNGDTESQRLVGIRYLRGIVGGGKRNFVRSSTGSPLCCPETAASCSGDDSQDVGAPESHQGKAAEGAEGRQNTSSEEVKRIFENSINNHQICSEPEEIDRDKQAASQQISERENSSSSPNDNGNSVDSDGDMPEPSDFQVRGEVKGHLRLKLYFRPAFSISHEEDVKRGLTGANTRILYQNPFVSIHDDEGNYEVEERKIPCGETYDIEVAGERRINRLYRRRTMRQLQWVKDLVNAFQYGATLKEDRVDASIHKNEEIS
ncbi:7264_t:CDS:2 [Acaulospora colombiana]|uniref:7264_t:CDS:1 n=1 Tax=Acaulospora colombiana TaxID=27376 RepID=A0ACA9KK98_9GLOM|nr:7264_t:CDS:2 [Acaulospora colombiana]